MTSAVESVSSVAVKYKGEMVEAVEDLRQRAVRLQEQAPQIANEVQTSAAPYKQEFIETAQDLGPVTTPAGVVLSALLWSSVVLFGNAVSTYVSAVVLAPILSAAVGSLGAVLFALVGVPVYGYYGIKSDLASGASDSAIRFRLLTLGLIEGLPVGVLVSNSYLGGAPLAFLLVGLAAVLYPTAAEKFGNNRQMLLGISVGGAVGVTAVLGLLLGSLTVSFLLLTLLYGATTALTLQYVFHQVQNESVPTYVHQLALLIGVQASYLLVHLVLGMNSDAYAQYQAKQ